MSGLRVAVLKGGREALLTNRALVAAIHPVLAAHALEAIDTAGIDLVYDAVTTTAATRPVST